MNQLTSLILLLVILMLGACGTSDDSKYRELGWEDLKPAVESLGDGAAAGIDDYYDDGSALGGLQSGIFSNSPLQSYSSAVVAEVDGTDIRVPGFVVPVEFDGDQLITEFFLVPFFGACYHKPPPPPNQTIYVTSAKPIKYESIYDPVWITGVIKTQQIGNDIATAAYSMDLHGLTPYEE